MEQNTNEPKNWLSRFFQRNNKVIAREFIILVFAIIVCSVISLGINYMDDLISKHNQAIQDKIDKLNESIPHRKELWVVMKENKLYHESYEKFKSDYKEVEDQCTLYHLIHNNKLFEESLGDFRLKYFKKDKAIDEAYIIYYERNDYHGKDYYIYERSSFINDLNKQEYLKKIYDAFVRNGYRDTIEDFKSLLTEDENDRRDIPTELLKTKLKDLDSLKSEIKDYYYHNYTIEVFLCVFLLLFGLRYLVYFVKWSVKQL